MGKHIQIKYCFVLALGLFLSLNGFSQENRTISGFVVDKASGERLTGATVFVPEIQKGVVCNDFGYFSISLPSGEVNMVFRFVGYEPYLLHANFLADTIVQVQLKTSNLVREIEVKASSFENFLLSPEMGMHRLSALEVTKIPSILGEPDPLKVIQQLPGVTFANEGSTAFSVRGGSPDQTLIRLDGVPVYNVNHLWGFMSAFNNDAIKETKLYKGSLPARFGGRLSSVLDIGMKEGNMKKSTGTFSLSPIAGRFTQEGPIVKDKISYMVSGRTTWANLLLLAALKLESQNEGAQILTYGFWDINAKTNWIINPQNRVYLSFYTGRDAYVMEDDSENSGGYVKFSYNWQNLTGVLRWNHIFSPTLFANFSAYNSGFKQEYFNKFGKTNGDIYKGYNNLNDLSLKGDFDWSPAIGSRIKMGFQLSTQKFSPEIISYKFDTTAVELNKDIFTRNLISEIYGEADVTLSNRLKGNLGLRGGIMSTCGEKYWSLRPRATLRYLISEQLSGKISYSRMKQYLHQLRNTTIGIPTEFWVSSTAQIKPGTSDLFSAGIFWKPGNTYNLSMETYYSKLNNVIRYKSGTIALKERGESWEKFITSGTGNAYGLELMAEKTNGTLTGWISYTISKSNRKFKDINFGNTFPYAFDRRHQINIVASYFLGEKNKNGKTIHKELSGSFKFASGNYITLAEQEYSAIPLPLMEGSAYSSDWFYKRSLINSVNNYRMPNFHHLNISYQIERQSEGKTILWNFSVYNIYNRLNPWYYYKKGEQMKQISLFPIIPSVSFTYKW